MSLQGRKMMSDDFELGGEDETPTSSVTFSTYVKKKALSHGMRQSRVSSSFSMGDMRKAANRERFCWRSASGARAPKILPLTRARRIAAGAAKDKNILSFCERQRQPRRFQPIRELIINNHL